jgi:hypothetical protein
MWKTYERICLLFSLTENLLLARWTCRPSRPITINSGLITFKASSEKEQNEKFGAKKWTKNGQKWPKMAKTGQKLAKNWDSLYR